LRILFLTKSHLPIVGGAEITTHSLASELLRRGHPVTVLARQDPRRPPHPETDRSFGYHTLRSARPEDPLPAVLQSFAPAIVVVGGYHAETVDWARRMLIGAGHLPTLLHLHDVASAPLVAEADLEIDGVVSVSSFVAKQVAAYGVEVTCIPPIVDRARYRVRSSRRVALFVNPVPQKGVETAFALARARPDVPFAFTRCWYLAPEALLGLRERARELANVELREGVSDPALLYGDAKLLLVPSTYPEAWARVAPEAQMSAIPVLASDVGGLPEAVGDGGILVDPGGGVELWSEALASVWDDDVAYQRCVSLAERAGTRIDLQPSVVGDRFEALLQQVVGARATAT
jgi:glycosyltransferase involved in cell wall biosynthesis